MNDSELLEKINCPIQCLDGEIKATTDEEFKSQFRSIFSSAKAKSERGVVYMWFTNEGIPRMSGESNIIYIGKTINTLYERLHRWADVEGSNGNWKRYKYIMKKFGPIKVKFAKIANPREAEKNLLKIYFNEHLEYPPMNAGG